MKGSNGVPSIVHVICRTACVAAEIGRVVQGVLQIIVQSLKNLKDSVLRMFNAKYFEKVVGLAKGKQHAKSVHNTYFDIIPTIAADDMSEIPVEYLYKKIVGEIEDSKQRSRKATSFYNCLKNLYDVIDRKGMVDISSNSNYAPAHSNYRNHSLKFLLSKRSAVTILSSIRPSTILIN